MRVAAMALIGLLALLAALLGAAGPAQADAPPDAGEPAAERWSADPRLWLALIEWRQRLRLELESSRELCTAGTLTEISWQIAGGKPPYELQVEGTPVNADADNIRINCGALSEAEAADEDASLAAKRISAVVTDSRGVRREAAIDVARARALPAPHLRTPVVQRTLVSTSWVAGSGWWLMRWRAATDSNWTYKLIGSTGQLEIVIAAFSGLAERSSYVFAVASLRDPIEQSTLDALIWSGNLEATTATTPTGVRTTSTHDTITVSWDDQPSVSYVYVDLIRADGAGRSRRVIMRRRDAVVTNQVTHIDLEPETEYKIHVSVHGDDEAQLRTTIRATTVAAPTAWQAPARGAQSLSVTATHDTITATWDAPTPNTRDRWIVYVEHSSWRRPYSRWVSAPLTFTLEGLTPATTYTVTVAHLDLYGVEVSTTVTTTPAPVQGQSSPGYPADPRLWLALIEWRQRLRLELASSRELCTAGTLTEISWQIAGGKPPYNLQVASSPVNADADNIRINCGALTEAEAADEDAALAAKRVTAVATDSRGVRREAAIDVARAHALPAPRTTGIVAYGEAITTGLLGDETKPDGATSLFIMRWRPTTSTEWSTRAWEHKHAPLGVAPVLLWDLRQGTDYQFEFATMRHRIEARTPEALRWVRSSTRTLAEPTGLSATATHSTVTVTWDEQPSASFFRVYLEGSSDRLPRVDDAEIYIPREHDGEAYSVVFRNVPSDREYTVRVRVGTWSLSESDDPLEATTTVRTTSPPQGWTAPPRGAQNVRTTTTSNSITVSWEAPYPDAEDDSYHLMLFHPTRSGIRHEWVDNGTTSYTFDNLEPGLTYRVVVDHLAIVESAVELEATTQSR